MDVKTGAPDPADFAMARLLLTLAYHAVKAAVCQWSQNHCVKCQHAPSCFSANCQNSVVHFPRLRQFTQWLCDHWHIGAVTALYADELKA
jgi:hypothetical protein